MSDTRSQLEEVDALIAATPGDPALQQLRKDLLQLIALKEQEYAGQGQPAAATENAENDSEPGFEAEEYVEQWQPLGSLSTASLSEQKSSAYTAQGTFMEHVVSKEAIAEAPDLGAFQPVVYSSNNNGKSALKSQVDMDSGDTDDAEASANVKDDSANTNSGTLSQPSEKKKKKKKKSQSDNAVLDAKFELPTHLVPLESDTPAQRLKKQRTAKALKSKFREKQKEVEHARRQNDWKSFAASGKKRRGGTRAGVSGSIFSTEEGVNARVGVISGGGGRKMTDFADPNKRYKFY